MSAIAGETGRPHRYALLDATRGLALVAMIIFHFAYDLDTLGLAPVHIGAPSWRWFARIIAGSFLALSGISLVIAHGQGIRWHAYLRRLAILALSAAAVTLVTWYAMPEEFIFFGILHAITVASVIGLAFLRAPWPLTLLCAIAVLVLPSLVGSSIFEPPPLRFIGLGTIYPRTMDFEPVFPWVAPFLFGMACAQFPLLHFAKSAAAAWMPSAWSGRLVAWAGRHTLAIYLVHQPLMFGTLALLAQAVGSDAQIPKEEDRPFLDACQATCVARNNGNQVYCRGYCSCTADELKGQGLSSAVLSDQFTPDQRARLAEAMRLCAKAEPPR
jgi:uncharacterized membrane protein